MTCPKLHWKYTQGGAMGPHYLLMLGDKYVGHLYIDASEGVEAEKLLECIAPIDKSLEELQRSN